MLFIFYYSVVISVTASYVGSLVVVLYMGFMFLTVTVECGV